MVLENYTVQQGQCLVSNLQRMFLSIVARNVAQSRIQSYFSQRLQQHSVARLQQHETQFLLSRAHVCLLEKWPTADPGAPVARELIPPSFLGKSHFTPKSDWYWFPLHPHQHYNIFTQYGEVGFS